MTETTRNVDFLILGGGPAGATAAQLLARQGREVLVVEREHFPRFHIGESLLPATVGLFQRLGVYEQVRDTSVHKPGGKWFYGRKPVIGNFGTAEPSPVFEAHRYSYMVERSTFDEILLRKAQAEGAEVWEGHEAAAVTWEGDRVAEVLVKPRRAKASAPGGAAEGAGLRGQASAGDEAAPTRIRPRWVLDGSGLGAVLARSRKERVTLEPRRMGIYSQIRGEALDPELADGWFVGEQLYDGWVWLIPLPGGRFSVGLVLGHEAFRATGEKPQALLERCLAEMRLPQTGVISDYKLIEPVQVTGDMSSASQTLHGENWVCLGDAAFFVDPCWSSGVHLAMTSAAQVTDLFEGVGDPDRVCGRRLREWDAHMRRYQTQVTRMVETFYRSSRTPALRKFTGFGQKIGLIRNKATRFFCGDFLANSFFIFRWYSISRLLHWLGRVESPPPQALIRSLD